MESSNQDDSHRPRIGKIEGQPDPRLQSFFRRISHVSALERKPKKSVRTFYGNRIGRGCGIGRVLSSRSSYAVHGRTVNVHWRITKLHGGGLRAARKHLHYIHRDGVALDGGPGLLYDTEDVSVDGKKFLDRCKDDRHQFRVIVAADDASEYEDLKPFVRKLMAQIEEDLGTTIDWVAADHFNTGYPHTHIVVRGKDDKGKDLVIAPEYIRYGIRERAAEIVCLDLGPRMDLEIENRLRSEVPRERFTDLDRCLLAEVNADGIVSTPAHYSSVQHCLRSGRLQKLRRLGLAEEVRPGQWCMALDLENILERMGEREVIMEIMNREMEDKGLARGAINYAIYDPFENDSKPLIGRLVARGLSDPINERSYLIVDGIDGRAHYVEIGWADEGDPVHAGSIVAVTPNQVRSRKLDLTVAEIASANAGRYSVDIHLRHDPTATAEYAEQHVRHLNAMSRMECVEREKDGTWIVGANHLDLATSYERKLAGLVPVVVKALSLGPLEREITAEGPTWLDQILTGESDHVVHDRGFGREVHSALGERQRWLLDRNLARPGEAGEMLLRADLLDLLRQRELNLAAKELSAELGLPYFQTRPRACVEGKYWRKVDLAGGQFAIIEMDRQFTLVPWQSEWQPSVGKPMSTIVRRDRIARPYGRERALEIS
jgi:type IV secretory pathway VirD2 relaxase